MKTRAGRFYLWFIDETLEEAISAHIISGGEAQGFKSIAEAVDEARAIDGRVLFKVLDSDLNTVRAEAL